MSTNVVVTEQPSGAGTVSVTVTFDRAALTGAGGLAALRSQLDTDGLPAAGWSVTGPTATSAGGASIRATHAFADPAQLSALAGQIAGPSVFKIELSTHRTYWHTDYRLAGGVDLTCGIDCFGDSGLSHATGSPVGVAPGSAASLAQVFTFHLAVSLPGAPAARSWDIPLGHKVALAESTQSVNHDHVRQAIAGAAVLAFLLVVLVGWLLVRRRRRRAGAW
ncbi:MAG TPA: hypothetical protein VG435_14810 [Acidimicrobiales bacterium]|nr:hypothetical protein [Acidimicrobiales bacterium]